MRIWTGNCGASPATSTGPKPVDIPRLAMRYYGKNISSDLYLQALPFTIGSCGTGLAEIPTALSGPKPPDLMVHVALLLDIHVIYCKKILVTRERVTRVIIPYCVVKPWYSDQKKKGVNKWNTKVDRTLFINLACTINVAVRLWVMQIDQVLTSNPYTEKQPPSSS